MNNETPRTDRYNQISSPEASKNDMEDMDFDAALKYLSDELGQTDQNMIDNIAKAGMGDIVAIDALLGFVSNEIQRETDSLDNVEPSTASKLNLVKIALDAHKETLRQSALNNAASAQQTVNELLSRKNLETKALSDISQAFSEGQISVANSISRGSEEFDIDGFGNKQQFNDLLYKVTNRLGLDSPDSLLPVSFDDLIPNQRRAVYDVLENLAILINSGDQSPQLLFVDTKKSLDKVMNGVNNTLHESEKDYTLAA